MKNKIILMVFVLYIIGTLIVYNIFINKAQEDLNKSFILENASVKNLYLMGWEYFPQEIIDKFNKEYPYIRVNFEKVDRSNYSRLLKARIASNVQVDIMSITPGDYKDFVNKEYLLDLTDEKYLDNYKLQAREEVKKLLESEKEYAVCYKSYVYGVWYNKTLFERYGLKVPKNYQEFIKVCEQLKKRDIEPFVLGVRDDWYSSYIYLLRLPKLSQENQQSVRGLKGISIGFDNTDTSDIMEDIDQFIKGNNLMKDSKYLTYYQAFNEFSKGKAAMIIMDDSSLSLVDSNMEKIMDPGVFAIPYKDEGVTTKVPSNKLGLMMGIFSNSQHIEEARIFLEYLSRSHIAQMYCDLMLFAPNIEGVSSNHIKYNDLWGPIRDMSQTDMSIDNLDSKTLKQLNVHFKDIITQEK